MDYFYESSALCGPRNIKKEDIAPMLMNLDFELGMLISQNVTTFRVIPSPGFNSYAALSVLNLKRIFPEAELEVLVGNFNNKLSEKDLSVRNFIITHADRVIDTEKLRTSESLSEILISGSSYLVSYSDDDPGFTSSVLECARRNGLQLIHTKSVPVTV